MISDFNLVELSSGAVLGKLSSIETIKFADDYSAILMELARNAGDGMTITGTYGSDGIIGTLGDDIIYGLGGNDNINTGDGDDLIYVQDENIEGPGKDWAQVEGGDGNDLIYFTNDSHSAVHQDR